MKTYTILHRWNQLNDDGCELVDAYLDKARALREMRSLAEKDRKSQEEYGAVWDDDFCQDDDTYISYGFYGGAFYSDTTNAWELVEQEVIE